MHKKLGLHTAKGDFETYDDINDNGEKIKTIKYSFSDYNIHMIGSIHMNIISGNSDLSEDKLNIFLNNYDKMIEDIESKVNKFVSEYKNKYGNIKKIFVYTSAIELFHYIVKGGKIIDIDGLNISIKTKLDAKVFESCIKTYEEVTKLDYNRLYVFDNLYTENPSRFKVIHREWQPNFKPANDSIFRKI